MKEAPAAEEKAAPAPKKKAAVPQLNDEKIAEVKKAAHDFLEGVFKTMDMDVEISEDYQKDKGILTVNMEGEDMGVLIGKRGQTLDSLQYLVSLVVNKGIDGYIHVKADTENYRERRKKTLENLAKNVAFKVKRTRQPVALEPMNPYERRIIHSALQNEKFITTYSEGEEPYRKVIVALKKDENGEDLLGEDIPSKGGRGRGGRGRNSRGGRGGRGYKGSRDNRRKFDQPEENGQEPEDEYLRSRRINEVGINGAVTALRSDEPSSASGAAHIFFSLSFIYCILKVETLSVSFQKERHHSHGSYARPFTDRYDRSYRDSDVGSGDRHYQDQRT